jgi:hypothetical protein
MSGRSRGPHLRRMSEGSTAQQGEQRCPSRDAILHELPKTWFLQQRPPAMLQKGRDRSLRTAPAKGKSVPASEGHGVSWAVGVPSYFLVLELSHWVNASKSTFWNDLGMPMPVSRTETVSSYSGSSSSARSSASGGPLSGLAPPRGPARRQGLALTRISIWPPSSVNLAALLSRLVMICRMRTSSAQIQLPRREGFGSGRGVTARDRH